jgi:mono/diheme cytochrome c family protein
VKRLVDVVQVLALLAAVVFVVALFANEPESSTPDASGAVDGAAIYAASCASCHGTDGQGNVGPALGGGAVVEAYPDPADQVAVVTDGRNAMPDFGQNLSPEEIEAVVAYTRDEL